MLWQVYQMNSIEYLSEHYLMLYARVEVNSYQVGKKFSRNLARQY